MPAHIPNGAMGRIPVILRLVLSGEDEEWWPGHAIRWTAGHVMVAWQQTPGDTASVRHIWLRATDVRRKISRPAISGENVA
ncbi:hypothetical protein EH165_08480 [Nakamurella antarctica]|uniref:Uncharacterized protein n=2 Tax=Nakamurella antarctica TaxID=1902245 RepID=A0A3G8ZQA5_9ACTN|nr:hypothetical protein EH165_08480 [Nakamurella antarctica]